MPADPPFSIDVTEEATDRWRIAVSGELDIATAPDLRTELRRCGRRGGEVVLDLRDVAFIDSSGIAMLVGIDAESRADGFGLSLLVSPPVRRVIELCDLQEILPVRATA